MQPGQKVYDDSDPAVMASIGPAQPHRDVDLAILDADKEGSIHSIFRSRHNTELAQAI